MMKMKRLFPVLSLSAFLGAFAPAHGQTPVFKVVCDLGGRHGEDADRVPHARELSLLREAVEDAYPHLPTFLQEVAREITFFVSHEKVKLTKRYMGWSAEDDPDYRWPDTRFYPQEYVDPTGVNRKGSIKANFTEKFIQTLELGGELGKASPAAARGTRSFAREIIAHELAHAWQYHTWPVRDLSRTKDPAPEGLADPAIIRENRTKTEYEHQAFAIGRRYGRGFEKDRLALADAIEARAKAEPALFAAKGPYHLLALDQPNPVVGRYLREETKNLNLGGDFTPTAKVIYEGQHVPAELVLRLKRYNDIAELFRSQLEGGGMTAAALLDVEGPSVAEIKKDWDAYMNAGPISGAVKESFPYLKAVEARFNKELERSASLSATSRF